MNTPNDTKRQTVCQLIAQFNLHAEPANDCGGVRLFCNFNRAAEIAAFDLADYAVDAVCGPFLELRPRQPAVGQFWRRDAEGWPMPSDEVLRKAYGKIPAAVGGKFQHNYGHELPVAVHGYQWSTTFGRWGALVTFADGWHGYTYPATWSAESFSGSMASEQTA